MIHESSTSEDSQQPIVLPIWTGGMAAKIFHLKTEAEHDVSRLLTKDIVGHIIRQNTEHKPNKERISEIKNNIYKGKNKSENNNLSRIRELCPKIK